MGKDHTYAVITCGRQVNAKHFAFTFKELMWNLYQNTGTIPCVLIGTGTTTMFKALQNAQTIVDNIMRFFPLNINNEAHATRILFKLAAVHTIGFQSSLIQTLLLYCALLHIHNVHSFISLDHSKHCGIVPFGLGKSITNKLFLYKIINLTFYRILCLYSAYSCPL